MRRRFNSEGVEIDPESVDSTHEAPSLLFLPLEVHPDVRCIDLFLLMSVNMDFFATIFGAYCRVLVAEALAPPPGHQPEREHQLDYARIYWSPWVSRESEFTEDLLPNFDGIGPADDDTFGDIRAGQPIAYSLLATPSYALAHLPLRVAPRVDIYDVDEDDDPSIATLRPPRLALGSLLYAVTRELSWWARANRAASGPELD